MVQEMKNTTNFFFLTKKMTYQSFSNYNPLNINDAGCRREFEIRILEDKYITQDDIYFNIEYANINMRKIDELYENLHEKSCEVVGRYPRKSIKEIKEIQEKIDEMTTQTIKEIEEETTEALSRDTPLYMFQNIELFMKTKIEERYYSIARRTFCGLDEFITDGCLPLNQIFPGIKFKYPSVCQLKMIFTRSPINNNCLKFECHYNLKDKDPEDLPDITPLTKYKEYVLPAGFYTGNIEIEPDVKSFKMVPCISYRLYYKYKYKDLAAAAKRLINECYDLMKLKYYKDGLEIKESEFGNSPGLYHIELLNKDELSKNKNFYDIDYKIICEC